jgi:hypothetical protein
MECFNMKWLTRDGVEFKGSEVVEVIAKDTAAIVERIEDCPRCMGLGGHTAWKNTGYVCFKCGGSGRYTNTIKLYSAEKLDQLEKAATARLNRKLKAEQKKRAEIQAINIRNHGEFIKILDSMDSQNAMIASVKSQHKQGKVAITEKQVKTVISILEREKEEVEKQKKFESIKLEDGKYEVEAELVNIKYVDNPFAYGTIAKALFVDTETGAKYYGTLPRKIDDIEAFDKLIVKFTATFEVKDNAFAVYKRPTKIKIVQLIKAG